MIFDIERKYIIAIAMLTIGVLVGGLVLFRQKSALGFAVARISQAAGGAGQWTEIKPRVENSAATNSQAAGTKTKAVKSKTIKAAKPVVNWCAQKNSDRNRKNAVINEVAWMGTAQSYSDEWIELKNLTADDIDLSGWQLQNKNQKVKISFNAGEVLPANGFYLLERTDDGSVPGVTADKIYSGSLGNSKEALYLFDAGCNVEDLIFAENKWPAGDNAAKKTMARQADLSWKTSKQPGGTPKSENF